MERTKTLAEDAPSAEGPEETRRVLPDQWGSRWRELEATIRERPGLYFLVALAIGYLLQALPFLAFLGLIGRLCLRLVKPALLLAGAVKLAEYLNQNQARFKNGA